MSNEIFTCPVCDEEFDRVEKADRHYDRHDPSEYIWTWRKQL